MRVAAPTGRHLYLHVCLLVYCNFLYISRTCSGLAAPDTHDTTHAIVLHAGCCYPILPLSLSLLDHIATDGSGPPVSMWHLAANTGSHDIAAS